MNKYTIVRNVFFSDFDLYNLMIMRYHFDNTWSLGTLRNLSKPDLPVSNFETLKSFFFENSDVSTPVTFSLRS